MYLWYDSSNLMEKADESCLFQMVDHERLRNSSGIVYHFGSFEWYKRLRTIQFHSLFSDGVSRFGLGLETHFENTHFFMFRPQSRRFQVSSRFRF